MPELYGEVCIEQAAGAFFVTNRNRFNFSLSLSRVPKVSAKKGAFPDECVISAVQQAKSEADAQDSGAGTLTLDKSGWHPNIRLRLVSQHTAR